jgi:hypothetical protein
MCRSRSRFSALHRQDARVTDARTLYLLNTDGWSDQQRRDACRAVLAVVAGDADRYECDIPFSPVWPADVVRAASALRDASRQRPRDPAYVQTGVLANDDPARWTAFVTFAPWALDASVWTQKHEHLVSLADEAESMALELTSDQHDEIAAILGRGRLLTKAENDQRRRLAK